jgi:hypothetical protein
MGLPSALPSYFVHSGINADTHLVLSMESIAENVRHEASEIYLV